MSAPHAIARSVYRPTLTQYRALEARDPFVGFFGGYGAGKTLLGAYKALHLAVENAGLVGLIVSPTWQMLTRTTLPTFKSICPPGLIVEEHKQERRLVLANGSTIYFGSADRPGSLEGTNVAWAWVDEARLVVREAWDVLVGRVRERRASRLQIVVTTTPTMGWLSEFFDGSPGRVAFHGSTRENAHNLAPGFVERLLATYSARKARALVEGQFTVLTGAVYEELDEARHRVAWRFLPELRTLAFVDFGVASPSVLLAQVTGDWPTYLPSGTVLPPRSVVVFDELQPDQTPTARLAPMLRERLAGRRLDAIYCDPAGNARSQETGIPSVQILRETLPDADIRWSTSPQERWIPNGVAAVQGLLAPADGSAARLYLDASLWESPGRRGIVRSMRGYSYPERADGSQASDQPVKDGVYDHACDALRYGVVGVLRDEGLLEQQRRGPVRVIHGGGG